MEMKYICESCGAIITTDIECPKCGSSEIHEVEEETLTDDKTLDFEDMGDIPNP